MRLFQTPGRFIALLAGPILLCTLGFAQDPANPPATGYKDSFRILYTNTFVAALPLISITNAGFHSLGTSLFGPPPPAPLCANIYTFRRDATFINCCSCTVPANGLLTFTGNLLFPGLTTNISQNGAVVKLLATVAPPAPAVCDPTQTPIPAGALGTPGGYAAGMRAWGFHSLGLTESSFAEVPLSAAEQQRLATTCAASPVTRCECPVPPPI